MNTYYMFLFPPTSTFSRWKSNISPHHYYIAMMIPLRPVYGNNRPWSYHMWKTFTCMLTTDIFHGMLPLFYPRHQYPWWGERNREEKREIFIKIMNWPNIMTSQNHLGLAKRIHFLLLAMCKRPFMFSWWANSWKKLILGRIFERKM